MKLAFEKYKGIHPGLILEHELKKRGIIKRQFALLVGEHPQTFNAITKGRRKLTSELSFKIDKALEIKQGTMLIMQAYHEISEYNKRQNELSVPSLLNKIRPGLFWDTDIHQIDWKNQADAVVTRIYERGNEREQEAVKEYYGDKVIEKVLTQKGRKAK